MAGFLNAKLFRQILPIPPVEGGSDPLANKNIACKVGNALQGHTPCKEADPPVVARLIWRVGLVHLVAPSVNSRVHKPGDVPDPAHSDCHAPHQIRNATPGIEGQGKQRQMQRMAQAGMRYRQSSHSCLGRSS